MTVSVAGIDELRTRIGTDLGSTEWLEITQDRINTFAAATDDHQWIHVDPERASAGPFGRPIAHGFLTLALVIPLWTQLLELHGIGTRVNYGLNKVRFPAPVPVGSRIRLRATLASLTDVTDGVEVVIDTIIECDASPKPACVAQLVHRYYP